MELSQELYDRVHNRFEATLKKKPRIDELMQKALRKEASYTEAHEYAQLIGADHYAKDAMDAVRYAEEVMA